MNTYFGNCSTPFNGNFGGNNWNSQFTGNYGWNTPVNGFFGGTNWTPQFTGNYGWNTPFNGYYGDSSQFNGEAFNNEYYGDEEGTMGYANTPMPQTTTTPNTTNNFDTTSMWNSMKNTNCDAA